MLLAQNHTHTDFHQCWWWSICVGSGSQPVFMCVFARMFAGCYLPAYSHCATGVNMLTLTHTHSLHKASPHQSSPTQCCWPAVCPVQSDCWVQERGMVVWPRPDKAAAPLPSLSVCRSHTSIHLSSHPPIWPTGCPAQTPAPTTAVYARSPQYCLVCVCVCLCPCPHHLPPYPQPPAQGYCTVPVFC